MICKNCIKRDVCIHLANFNKIVFESTVAEIGIEKCPLFCEIKSSNIDEIVPRMELPICDICKEKCYERYECKNCGKKVCIDCSAEYEINEITQEVECICIECTEQKEQKEKSEEDKLIDELF